MLIPNSVDCAAETTIPALLADIDEKLVKLACNLYNNLVYATNTPIKGCVINDLLNYKRILTYKDCNPNYASKFSVSDIANRVKVLKYR